MGNCPVKPTYDIPGSQDTPTLGQFRNMASYDNIDGLNQVQKIEGKIERVIAFWEP